MYLKTSTRPVEEVFANIEAAAKAEGFGVLHHYDFKKILAGKGFPIDRECRVLEVCNPRQAAEVLAADMALNLALPCRLSIYEGNDGATVIGRTQHCPIAMLELGPMLGIQAHPEFSATYVDALLDARVDRIGPDITARAKQSLERVGDAEDAARIGRLITSFLETHA